jgi:hypothetical protein
VSTSIQEEDIKGLLLTGMVKFVRMDDAFLICTRTMKKELNYELHEAYGIA